MLAFDVSLNGGSLCRAGVGKAGVLTATMSWVGGCPRAERPGGRTEQGETEFRVGGLVSANGDDVSLEWLTRVLVPGDEVMLRVVEVDTADPAPSKVVYEHDWLEKHERAAYRRMKRKYEGVARKRAPAAKRSNQMQRTRSASARRRGPRR